MNLQSARERRDAIKASRQAYAQSTQNAENQGASMTSSSIGGLGSIQSQLSSNLSFLDQFNTLTDQASVQIGIANKYTSRAQTAEAIGGLANTVAGNSNTISKVWRK